MNSSWGHLSNLWFCADTESPSPEDNPSQTGSSVDRGEFRLIIKDFSFPLISLGHFYVFFFHPLCSHELLIYTHWQEGVEASRDGALYPSIFYPLLTLSPVVLSFTTASLSFGGPRAPFPHLEQDITHTPTVALCQDTHSHGCLKCISNTRGVSHSFTPGLLLRAHLCCILL